MSTKRVVLAVLVASALALALSAGLQAAGTVHALPPTGTTLPYSGRLSDEAGQPVPDGAYDFAFALYDAAEGGNRLWAETQTGVAVRGGSFSTRLGSVEPIPAAVPSGPHWLAVSVRGPGETDFTALTPRQALAVPSAGPPAAPLAAGTSGGACPHDHFGEWWQGSSGLYGLSINNTGTGYGLDVVTGGTPGVSVYAPDGDGVSVSDAGGNGLVVASAGSDGVYVGSAGGTGVVVVAGGTGLDVESAVYDGLMLRNAGGDGVYVGSVGGAGVSVGHAAGNGLEVVSAKTNGVYVSSAGPNPPSPLPSSAYNGFEVTAAEGNGLYVGATGSNGVQVWSAGGYGVDVASAGSIGFHVYSAGTHGVEVESAGYDGVSVGSAGEDGVDVYTAGDNHPTAQPSAFENGFEVAAAEGNGLYVGATGGNGVHVWSAGDNGVEVDSAGVNGVYVVSAGWDGVNVRGNNYAGYFGGDIYVSGDCFGCTLAAYGLNAGSRALQPGDVVAIQGLQAAALDNAPLLWNVVPAGGAGAVVGVVSGRAELEVVPEGQELRPGETGQRLVPRDGAAQPGEYLTIVVSGPMQVRAASDAAGSIQPGTRLAVGADGLARPLQTVVVNGVTLAESAPLLGIALAAPDQEGLVWVLVNPQ